MNRTRNVEFDYISLLSTDDFKLCIVFVSACVQSYDVYVVDTLMPPGPCQQSRVKSCEFCQFMINGK